MRPVGPLPALLRPHQGPLQVFPNPACPSLLTPNPSLVGGMARTSTTTPDPGWLSLLQPSRHLACCLVCVCFAPRDEVPGSRGQGSLTHIRVQSTHFSKHSRLTLELSSSQAVWPSVPASLWGRHQHLEKLPVQAPAEVGKGLPARGEDDPGLRPAEASCLLYRTPPRTRPQIPPKSSLEGAGGQPRQPVPHNCLPKYLQPTSGTHKSP